METLELVKKPQEKKLKEKAHLEKPVLVEFNTFSLCVEMAILIFSGFLTYFLIMRSIGLHEVFELRYLNVIFLIAGITTAMHSYKKQMKGVVNYKKGLQIGMFITLAAVLPFALFIFLYLNIDDGFLSLVEKASDFQEYISPGTVASYIGLEGICSGSIITFIVMQFYKKKQKKLKCISNT